LVCRKKHDAVAAAGAYWMEHPDNEKGLKISEPMGAA